MLRMARKRLPGKVLMIVEKVWLGYVMRNLFGLKGYGVVCPDATLKDMEPDRLEAALRHPSIVIINCGGGGNVRKLMRLKKKLGRYEILGIAVSEDSRLWRAFEKAGIRHVFTPEDPLPYLFRKVRRILQSGHGQSSKVGDRGQGSKKRVETSAAI